MQRTIVTRTYETNIEPYGSELSIEYEDDIIDTAIDLYELYAAGAGEERDVPVVLCKYEDSFECKYFAANPAEWPDNEVEQFVVHVRASQHRM